jgi:predicted nucleic acid-binding Zn ribbon protein
MLRVPPSTVTVHEENFVRIRRMKTMGKPEDVTEFRTCSVCGESFPLTEEYFREREWGFLRQCKTCERKYQKDHYKKHRGERRAKGHPCRHCGEPIVGKAGRPMFHMDRHDCYEAWKKYTHEKQAASNRRIRLERKKGVPGKERKKRGKYFCQICGKRLPDGYRFRHDTCLEKLNVNTDDNYIYSALEL